MVLRALPEAKRLNRSRASAQSKLTRPKRCKDAPHSKSTSCEIVFCASFRCAHASSRRFSCCAAGLSAQHFQKCERVFRSGAFGVVIEINVHIAVFL